MIDLPTNVFAEFLLYIVWIVIGLMLGYVPVKAFWHFAVWGTWKCNGSCHPQGWK
jgi:hypothetical protein